MKLSVVVLLLVSSTVTGRYSRGSSHTYPHSSGHSGYGSSGSYSSHTYSGSSQSYSSSSHSYPASSGLSGTSNRGNVRQTYHQQHSSAQYNYSPKTEIHHHYHYSPPQQIRYGTTYQPVYQGSPPVYVYEYRDSGSRFDTLLTGLALYNLGRSQSHHYDSNREYSRTPGEICKLGISRRSGEYEETRIECRLMSSFIWESDTRTQNEQHTVKSTTTEVKITQTINGNGTVSNSSVTTVTSSKVEDALSVKGPSIAVTPDMTCYMIRIYRDTTTMRKPVDCALLQEYARSSLYRSSSEGLKPLLTILFSLILCLIIF